MKISCIPFGNIPDADAIAVFVERIAGKPEKADRHQPEFRPLGQDHAVSEDFFNAAVSAAVRHGFSGKVKSLYAYHPHETGQSSVYLIGLGNPEELTPRSFMESVAKAAKLASAHRYSSLGLVVPQVLEGYIPADSIGQYVVMAVQLGSYRFHKLKSEDDEETVSLNSLVLVTEEVSVPTLRKSTGTGHLMAEAVANARDLVNEPPSVTTPTYLAKIAESLATTDKTVTCTVYGKKQIADMKMGGLLGIAQGSYEEPKFIELRYTAPGNAAKTITIIGKGITFDTGGLSLKPPSAMETMKLDMAGAATVLGIFSILPKLAPAVNVVGLIPATENMPGGRAVKPGDVVRTYGGKTIEIKNTDAEGRVILADALSYAAKNVTCDAIIDFATLTGACMVALGEEYAGVFSSDDQLRDNLLAAARNTGELLWPMPLVPEYRQQIKSTVADVVNSTKTRYGGAITAALFLQEFTDAKIPWAHLDIAGPAYAEKAAPLTPEGGTGYGVALMVYYIQTIQ